MTESCLEVAAYLLCALDSDEQIEFESHLESCPDCCDEIAELAAVVTRFQDVELEPDLWPEDFGSRSRSRDPRGGRPGLRSDKSFGSSTFIAKPAAGSLDGDALREVTGSWSPRPDRRKFLRSGGLLAAAASVLFFARSPGDAEPSGEPFAAVTRTFQGSGPNVVSVSLSASPSGGSSISVTCTIAVLREARSPVEMTALWVRPTTGSDLYVTSWPLVPATMSVSAALPVALADIAELLLRDDSGAVVNSVTL